MSNPDFGGHGRISNAEKYDNNQRDEHQVVIGGKFFFPPKYIVYKITNTFNLSN